MNCINQLWEMKKIKSYPINYLILSSLDGLLVKRPLGWACCSCDKELNNY